MIALLLACQSLTPKTFSPKTVSLNDRWKLANLSNPPSIWTGADAIPTSQWKVLKVSSEESKGENALASQAFDGNPKSIWHTRWLEAPATYPHELVIDLGVKTEAVGFRLLPRQTGAQNGKPNHIQVFLSNDLASWGSPVVADAIPNTSELFQRQFLPVTARYLRFVVVDGHRGAEPFLAIAELGLVRNLDAKQKKDWESQYHIATVETGDARFDLKGEALEQVKAEELAKIKPGDWHDATLPHAAWIRPLYKTDIWQGVTYYKREIDIAPEDVNQYVELSIGAAMQVSDLWLNGQHISTRRGGYLPLVANLTGKAKAHNEILVRLDNGDNPLVPPGKPQQDLDFMYGAGITREAKLEIHNKVFITRNVGSEISNSGFSSRLYFVLGGGETANLAIGTCVRNETSEVKSLRVFQQLGGFRDTSRLVKIPSHGFKIIWNDFSINSPKLWSTASPYLYSLSTKIVDKEGGIIDSQSRKIGICSKYVSREYGFLLNGKPLELIGTNRHQDYPWVGPALSRQANYRDAKLIKESGHNIVRLSHYPQSEEFLDACDELGILTIPCIAGWQFLNKDLRFANQVKQVVRELVQREASHPCVAWFETSLNETYPDNATAKSWADAARSTIVGPNILLAGDARPGAPWDIAYNQWRDDDFSRPQDAMPGKPGYIREYGDYEFGGASSSSRVTIGQGMKKLLQETWNHIWSVNHLRPQLPWTMGYGTWEMFDHNVPYGSGVSASGLCDLFRREKPSFWFYKSQSETHPFAKLAADWQPGAPTRKVVVFTNCDEAVLTLNGKEIARAKPERHPATKYENAKPFDGSNTVNLMHPPIVFPNIAYKSGTLKVIATRGKEQIQDELKTAGAPERIRVWIDDIGVPTGRNDLVFVRADVIDKNGNVCPSDSRRIHFAITGATLAGESDVDCEMGVASVLIRTPLNKANIQITASAKGVMPSFYRASIR